MGLFEKMFGTHSERELKKIKHILDSVLALEEKYAAMTDEELQNVTPNLKKQLEAGYTCDDILPDAFAACREAAVRVLGQKPFPVQVLGGIVLHQGRIAEMKTGEGKTLTATLPVYLNALAGKGVHVVTVNDYLAKFQGEWMGRLYEFLGLSTGLILANMTPAQRRASYDCDITYGTNNEFGFDYLRDNMVVQSENLVQRGHFFAVVDEVDSILIDEARTPLIISGQVDQPTEMYTRANEFVRRLKMVKITEMDDKSTIEETDEFKDADYVVEEKHRSSTLTAKGIEKAEAFYGVENLTDPENSQISQFINQALMARGIMKRDVDYVVKDNEVLIVDEFTGRIMYGRRYNNGLHQAIEAKEGVTVESESQTVATITFQNYFRLYNKLSGMTGTALTEEEEFRGIYALDVIEIPTNRPMIRKDYNDSLYKTRSGKYDAIIEQIVACHEKGQPVLVGTISIEKSELLSEMLKRRGIKHEVLNAKRHEREALIVAQAGQKGAVTIATNMAGRGTDILLGGNAEYMARSDMEREGYTPEMIVEAVSRAKTEDPDIIAAREKFVEYLTKHNAEIADNANEVRAAGGLFIIGTERHESRRIDNQLRGRSGRQGDPGESRFFLSLEDDLMRLFGGDRLGVMMNSVNLPEDTPIEAGMFNKLIETCQKRVEERNFSIRKNVLQYDDVMSRQREIIYRQRRDVLDGKDISSVIKNMLSETVSGTVSTYLDSSSYSDSWDLEGLKKHFLGWLTLPTDFDEADEAGLKKLTAAGVTELLEERGLARYAKQEAVFGEHMRDVERIVLLRNVDSQWVDHIDAMSDLKEGLALRGYGQHDPVIEYREEGFDMFESMIAVIRENTVRQVLTVVPRRSEPQRAVQIVKPTAATHGDTTEKKKTPLTVKKGQKIGRNDPCPCGSGKKYKNCCGKDEQ